MSMEEIFEAQIKNMAAVLRPASIVQYRRAVRVFLSFLHSTHPEVKKLSQLRRDPHILGWLRSLYERQPRLANKTRMELIISLRRLLKDLATGVRGAPRDNLFARGDYPPRDKYLPQPLSPEDDEKLLAHLRLQRRVHCYALRLMRATGMRIGECLGLSVDALRELGPGDWAIRVPLGKLHTERWVPVDQETCDIFRCLQSLRNPKAGAGPDAHSELLLLHHNGKRVSYTSMRDTLIRMASQAGCSIRPHSHQLRHTYATGMLRAGASLPVVKELLGHTSIEMTMRYVQVSQVDLQREYHQALKRMEGIPAIPSLPTHREGAGICGLTQDLKTILHRMEMLRRQLTNPGAQKDLQRLADRLRKIRDELEGFDSPAV